MPNTIERDAGSWRVVFTQGDISYRVEARYAYPKITLSAYAHGKHDLLGQLVSAYFDADMLKIPTDLYSLLFVVTTIIDVLEWKE